VNFIFLGFAKTRQELLIALCYWHWSCYY